MFIVSQGHNLTVILAAACNLKLLSLKPILFSFPKTKENNKSKRILSLRTANFQIRGIGGQLSKCWRVRDAAVPCRSSRFTFAVVVPLAAEDAVLLLDVSPAEHNVLPALGVSLPDPAANTGGQQQSNTSCSSALHSTHH